jgi:hypothetical protein
VLASRRLLRDGSLTRPRYWCYPNGKRTEPGAHRFSATRQHKTGDHPSGTPCHECEAVPTRFQGPAVAWDWDFSAREIADLALAIGRGSSYRAAATQMRLAARRVRTDQNGLPVLSNEGTTAQRYLDLFGPALVEADRHTAWPRVLLLDYLPIRSNLTDADGRPQKGGETRGAILMAAGYTEPVEQNLRPLRPAPGGPVKWRWTGPRREPHLWAMEIAGTADAASWHDFLSSRTGEPEWIVTDGDQAVRNAVLDLWGQRPVLYSCEGHLIKRFLDRAYDDDQISPRAALALFDDALRGQGQWWEFVRRVAVLPARDRQAISSWISYHHALVLDQMAKRRRGFPRGIGALEAFIVKTGDWIGERRKVLMNVRRTNLMLGLMRNQLGHHADAAAYTEIVRRVIAAKSRPHSQAPANLVNWRANHDRQGKPSLYDLVDQSVDRGRAYASSAQRDALHRSMERKIAAANDYRESLGYPPLRVSTNAPPQVLVGGDKLSDHPEVAREWDHARNEKAPTEVAAGSPKKAHWICANDPTHLYQASVNQRTSGLTGCSRCAHRGPPKPPTLDELLADAPPAFVTAPDHTEERADDGAQIDDQPLDLPDPQLDGEAAHCAELDHDPADANDDRGLPPEPSVPASD